MVEFNTDGTIKDKTYLSNCEVRNKDFRPVIIITYNKYSFLVNEDICKVYTSVRDIFLYLKSWG